MARRRKKKSSKGIEPFNRLFDLAAGATMHVIADNMEEKHHYRKRGVPNPYRASAVGLSSGRLKKVEDIIKLGGVMGAMGAFDPDDTVSDDYLSSLPSSRSYKTNNSWEYDSINASASVKNNNKYAWRLNCEDGSEYGIYPENYETREDYSIALLAKKQECNSNIQVTEVPVISSTNIKDDIEVMSQKVLFVCKVSRLDNGANQQYRTYNDKLKIGNIISVPSENGGNVQGVILYIEKHIESSATSQFDDLPFISE